MYKCTCCNEVFDQLVKHGCKKPVFKDLSLSDEVKTYDDKLKYYLEKLGLKQLIGKDLVEIISYLEENYGLWLSINQDSVKDDETKLLITGWHYDVIDLNYRNKGNSYIVTEDFQVYPDLVSVYKSGLIEELAYISLCHIQPKIGN